MIYLRRRKPMEVKTNHEQNISLLFAWYVISLWFSSSLQKNNLSLKIECNVYSSIFFKKECIMWYFIFFNNIIQIFLHFIIVYLWNSKQWRTFAYKLWIPCISTITFKLSIVITKFYTFSSKIKSFPHLFYTCYSVFKIKN